MSLYAIEATLILDLEGRRLLTKYYSPPNAPKSSSELVTGGEKAQRSFEKRLSGKTRGVNGDILLLDGHIVVYKQLSNVIIYLVAPGDENEAMVFQALITLRDTVDTLLDHLVDKTRVLEMYDRVALAVDEVIDNGIILTNDSRSVASRITTEADEEPVLANIDLSENGIRSMFDFAKGRLAQAVRQQLG